MDNNTNKPTKQESAFRINWAMVLPIGIIMLAVIALSFINQDAFAKVMSALVDAEVVNFKWIVGPTVLLMIVTAIVVWIHPMGKIKLGGTEAKPLFKTFSYWGLTICSTIATGIVFYGVVQPLTYFEQPWPGWGEPESATAAVRALAQNNLEWAWGQYAAYTIWAIVLGIAIHNLKQPMKVSSFFYVLRGKKAGKGLNTVIDIMTLIGIVAGVTCSLGTGTMQISAGLKAVFGIDVTNVTWLIVEAIIVVGFLLMSVGGIAKGIKVITDRNFNLYIIVLIIMALFGPTLYIFDMFIESTGMTFQTLIQSLTYTGGADGNTMPIYWMIWQFVSCACFAPITGLFLAKVSRGRTIKEIVTGVWIVPSLFNCIWFVVFGSIAFDMQTSGQFDLWGSIESLGMEQTMFELFKQFPGGIVLCVVFLIVIYLSFVTLASSATTTASFVSMIPKREVSDDEEPPMYMKTFWALLMALSAYVMISFAGITGAKSFAMIGGMPTIVLEFLAAIAVFRIPKMLKKHSCVKEVKYVENYEVLEDMDIAVEDKEAAQ
ncbi:MAG: BCCT family transporter [Suipraeoptans sp.]